MNLDHVTQDPGIDGLALMLADLIRANIERDPARAALVQNIHGTINVIAKDADVEVGLEFAENHLHVFEKPFKRAGLEIICDASTLLDLSNTPLLFGQPDIRTREGRHVFGKILKGTLKVKGMVAHPVLLSRLQRLLSSA
ncbi:MAG: hypothetical protein ACYDCC_09220 [Actinomycetota bacterium]